MRHIACSGIGIALLVSLFGLPAGAQNQASSTSPASAQSSSSNWSLGDYARQVRKTPANQSRPKVYDNDNLPKDDKLSVVGQVAPEPTAAAKPAETTAEAPGAKAASAPGQVKGGETVTASGQKGQAAANTPEEEEAQRKAAAKQWADKLATQKDQIALLTRELDVLQREYQIRAAAMYADAGNRMRNSADWDKQDAQYKQQIADKQKALDEARQKLDDTMEQARKAGVSSSIIEP